MKTVMHEIDGQAVFVSAWEVWVGNQQKVIGAFKLHEPPGMIGGEFVKDDDGKTEFFNHEQAALDAALDLYNQKKAELD